MTRTQVADRVLAEVAAWQVTDEPREEITFEDIDVLQAAVGEALQTCGDEIAEEDE